MKNGSKAKVKSKSKSVNVLDVREKKPRRYSKKTKILLRLKN